MVAPVGRGPDQSEFDLEGPGRDLEAVARVPGMAAALREVTGLDEKSTAALEKAVKNLPVAPATSAGEFQTVRGYQDPEGHLTREPVRAVVGSITVNERPFTTVLSPDSFNLTDLALQQYARSLECRLAPGEVHESYVRSLLAKEADGTINPAEERSLKISREGHIRNKDGGISVKGGDVEADDRWMDDYADPKVGALFVLCSEEST